MSYITQCFINFEYVSFTLRSLALKTRNMSKIHFFFKTNSKIGTCNKLAIAFKESLKLRPKYSREKTPIQPKLSFF